MIWRECHHTHQEGESLHLNNIILALLSYNVLLLAAVAEEVAYSLQTYSDHFIFIFNQINDL